MKISSYSPASILPRLPFHAAQTIMIATLASIAFGIIQMPDSQAKASVITTNHDLPHLQAQLGTLPTITVEPVRHIVGESQNQARFEITRSGTATGALTVDVEVTQDELGRYVADENLGLKTVAFNAGQFTVIYVVPTLSHSHHHDGQVYVEIKPDSTDPAEYTVGDPSTAEVWIIHGHEDEDEVTPTPTGISYATNVATWVPQEAVSEGSDAVFIFARGCSNCGDASLDVRVAQDGEYVDIDAYESHEEDSDDEHSHEEDSDDDERYKFQTVTIPHGRDRVTLSVPTVDDDIAEADGKIAVVILSVDYDPSYNWRHVITPGFSDIATANIKSDDPPKVTVSAQNDSARIEGDDIVFQIHRTGPMDWPEIPVRVQPADTGNFLQNSRITTVTIPANHVSATHTVQTVDDHDDEEHGSVTLTVLEDDSDPAAYRVGVDNRATVTVADNDPLELRFNYPDDATNDRVSIIDPIPVPQSGSGTYTLKMSRRPISDVTVVIESDSHDITVEPSQVTFTDSNWERPVSVEVVPKLGVSSGATAKLTHRLNCLVAGSSCGYSGAEESIDAQVVQPIVDSPRISRIVPKIRNVTVSPSEQVVLTLNIFGRQNIQDQALAAYLIEWHQGNDRIEDYSGPRITYTAPSAPGTYTVNARVAGNACAGDSDDCSAQFEITVRRPQPPQSEYQPPVNPAGEIPPVIVDDQVNQYEVFTPQQGGKFDSAERYSIATKPGTVPNGEIIGVRMSEGGAAQNSGMTQHRYTLGGNRYAIHVVDASGNEINTYRLNQPAEVCVPLPRELRSNISKLALVSLNSNDTLTILSARVRLDHDGPSVCGNLSTLPATIAVGSRGAPAIIPAPTPDIAEDNLPETGATAPSSNTAARLLILGILIATLTSATALTRSRAPRT